MVAIDEHELKIVSPILYWHLLATAVPFRSVWDNIDCEHVKHLSNNFRASVLL